jgi:hypothetical protein
VSERFVLSSLILEPIAAKAAASSISFERFCVAGELICPILIDRPNNSFFPLIEGALPRIQRDYRQFEP